MGYHRAEVPVAALNAGALVVLATWIAPDALYRPSDPNEILAGPLVAIASVGLLVNLVIIAFLHGSHDLNSRAVLWHLLGDAMGSLAAIAAGVVLWAGGPAWVDPAVSLGISAILVFGSM